MYFLVRFAVGTSKAGKPYDFTVCYVSYSAFGVDGVQVSEVFVDSRMIQFDALNVNGLYEFDYDAKGNLINVFIEE